ncbi:hypothetical protein CPB84DRAFT_1064264 [Gymnopilus junonius]|uniref:Uncharacterized protein n=1 Tax=Gymnopilus junonius TaxID=109634 RepID=A0A9P5NYQ7_GYMJU|nr:hypothetical protein CPB84DRAFT_1064264 [Gymnopilus junonius]
MLKTMCSRCWRIRVCVCMSKYRRQEVKINNCIIKTPYCLERITESKEQENLVRIRIAQSNTHKETTHTCSKPLSLSPSVPMSELTIADIHSTVQVTVSHLSASGIVSCLVGSVAGSEHGITRTPNVGTQQIWLASANKGVSGHLYIALDPGMEQMEIRKTC